MTNSTKKKQEKDTKKHIHVVLSPNRIKKFDTLKTELEQNSDVDVVRLCLDKAYDDLGKEPLELRDVLTQQVRLILDNDYYKNKHIVDSVNDIVNDAVHTWIQDKKQEINLHHFPFRKGLEELEKRVALVFVEHQLDYDRGMTLDDILSHLDKLNQVQLRRILKKFIDNNLLIEDQYEGTTYYYAPLP